MRSAWTCWLDRLRLIPPGLRAYDLDPLRAELHFGLTRPLLDQLLGMGMAHVLRDGVPWVATLDAHYLGLRLGVARIPLRVLADTAATLDLLAARPRTQVRVVAYARGVETTIELAAPGGRRVAVEPSGGVARFELELEVEGSRLVVGHGIDDVLAEVAALDFCFLPAPLQRDVAFVRRSGLGDCWSACNLLLAACRRRGLEARPAFGLMLSRPYATPQSWTEVQIDGAWIAVNPLLLSLLWRFGGLARERWGAGRSPGSALVRLAGEEVPLARTAGGDVELTYVTRIAESRFD